MKKFLAGTAFIVTLGLSGIAAAAPGHSSGNVNLRAGPGINYPVVGTIPARQPIQIEGCLEGWSWCNVFWRGNYGWVSGRFTEPVRDSSARDGIGYSVPAVTYDMRGYWDRHYSAMPFYSEREKYGYNLNPVPVAVTNRPPLDRTGGNAASSMRNRINHMRDDRWYKPRMPAAQAVEHW